jgi:Helix-turn-helix domain
MRSMTPDPQPYIRLAIAILQQALADASATHTVRESGRITPTPADVADARAFLASHAFVRLTSDMELHPGYVRRLVAGIRLSPSPPATRGGETTSTCAWLSVDQAAARFGYTRERVRQLIRLGRIRAAKASDTWSWRVDPVSVAAYQESLSALHRR